ncbi:GNAT family N-acetyltransferase [Thalassorhabdomicrobium marinisediminis]|uniref:N-acetyltransferase domain-containing protein n=1 Tax=Thalassorhabdomicrobium marinisediminis TaxID=2170577 RepID=A0A2T7FZU1_9RHOB|nr:GNAT family N-acetyltransferase [Thalassorhabdomicrobium marinisediminis]PVA07686.1 hypothetical protein DC363_03400 [Thalassorhabdomicrobium marinisediminis]
MLRSLAMRSELLTLSGISHLTQQDGYLVQATPSEPDFWMGNQIILSDTDRNGAEAIALFERHFPQASHRAIVWDIPGLDPTSLRGRDALGAPLEGFDTMTLQGPLRDAPVPKGITLRPVVSEEDWRKAEALQAEIGQEEGRDPVSHAPYLARRNAGRRDQIAKGLGAWFGALDGDRIVAQMGMFHDAGIARYQAVETRASHRRRGICSALLRHAALWALQRAPDATVVIVAEADSDAGRLYRRMGFDHAETIYGVVRDGY